MMYKRKRWSREDREFIEASVGKMTSDEMAKKLNVSITALRAYARRINVSLKVGCITEHEKHLCRELYKDGLTISAIAQKMELSNQAVFNIVYKEH